MPAGRPEFKPTKAMRDQVAAAAGGGMSHDAIAAGLGVCRNTLEKHFGDELTTGAHKKRLRVMQALYTAATKGNVSAAKAYLAADPGAAERPQPKPDEPAKVGKKEQAEQDARTAAEGTGWGSILPEGGRVPIQ